MRVVDMHCDTILELLSRDLKGKEASLYSNDLSIDLEKMKKGNYLLQNFALFTDQKELAIPEQQTMRLYDEYCTQMDKYADYIAPVYTFSDIEKNDKEGKLSSLLTLEDGGVCFNDLAMLRNYYRMGVRMIALTWNYENGIGYPNLSMKDMNGNRPNYKRSVDTERGLTEFGISYVKEMERLGMIVDVSHLNDAGFYDVLKYTTKPFVASHSNARSVCNVARNMSDDMILQLAKRGGVMGLNFCGSFLADRDDHKSCVEDMVKHILYIKDLAGIDVIGLGTDFDGISCPLEIEDASMINLLEEDLNTSLALTKIFDQVKILNQVTRVREKDNDVIATEYATLVKMGDVLGFLFEGTKLSKEDIALYEEWNAYKKEKNFDEADRVRKELTERGIL